MKIINRIFLAALSAVAVFGCSRSSGEGMTIERFDRVVSGYKDLSETQRDSVRNVYKPVVDFMTALTGATDSDSMMMLLAGSKAVEVFQPDIEARLGDLGVVETALGDATRRAEADFADLKFPRRVIGIVMPYDQSVVVCDSVVLIGLNHYLGADYPGYSGFDDYRRALKVKQRIASDVVEATVRSFFPYEWHDGSTVASRIAYEGAVLKMVSDLLSAGVGDILGYNDDELNMVSDNESELWTALVSSEKLYSVDRNDADRLVVPAPFSTLGVLKAPGRVGGFLGFKMIDSYLSKNSKVNVYDVLNKKLYNEEGFVVRSGYVGK